MNELWLFVLSLCGITPAVAVAAHAAALVLAWMVVKDVVNLVRWIFVI
jgi:hypothetical protein